MALISIAISQQNTTSIYTIVVFLWFQNLCTYWPVTEHYVNFQAQIDIIIIIIIVFIIIIIIIIIRKYLPLVSKQLYKN